ncbi:aldehyde dehydrogenase family protein, partial [Mesorhizobium sp. M2A.F.Ca.ET.040.01.1.1]
MSYPEHVLLHINGEWKPAASGKTLPIINPANETVLGRLAHAEIADLDEALAAAENGFQLWSRISAFERYKLMRAAAVIVRERANIIA